MTRIVPLKSKMKKHFETFLERDLISNFFALLNLRLSANRSKFWLALDGEKIIGYLLEHEGRIVSLRGDGGCAVELLRMTDLTHPELNVEPDHIMAASSLFEPINPVGTSRDRINIIAAMAVEKSYFKPVTNHKAKKLGVEEIIPLSQLYERFYAEMTLGNITREQVSAILERSMKYGASYGIYEGDELVSFASGNGTLEIAHLAPVYTLPESRSKGYATSACSALTKELLSNSRAVMLFVSEKNVPALKVYTKIGFIRTGHTFLTYRGRRLAT